MSCSHTPKSFHQIEPQNTPIQSQPNTKNPRTRTTPLIHAAEGIKLIYPLSFTKATPGDFSGADCQLEQVPAWDQSRELAALREQRLHVLVHLDLEVTPHLARVASTPDMQCRHERRRREEQPARISSAQNHHLPAPPPHSFALPSTPRNWGPYVPLESR